MKSSLVATVLLALTLFTVINANDVSCSSISPGDVVNGDVIANSGICVLDGVTVKGDVKVANGASLTTKAVTSIDGDIKGDGTGFIMLRFGTSVKAVDVKDSNDVIVTGSTISAGLKVDKSNGDLIICGSNVKDVIEFKESNGRFRAVQSPSCAANSLSKDIKIEKGTGNVLIIRNDIGGDGEVSIKERDGRVTIQTAELNKLTIEKVEKRVLIDDADITEAQIKENTGGVIINNSDIEKLDCQDNSPPPTGSGNNVSDGSGQCSGF